MNHKLFHDNLFVQMTPGEVSQDQATRNYFYHDPTFYVNDGLAANFWSPAGESLEVGSLITMRGILGKQGTLPLPHPHTHTQVTFQVWKKELNPPGHRDKYRIWVNIGPNTTYVNSVPTGGVLGDASDLTMQNSVCKYRGFVMYKPVANPTPVQWTINIGASRFHIATSDYCWGKLISPPHSQPIGNTRWVNAVVPLASPETIDIYFSGGFGPIPIETSPGSGVYFPFWVYVEIHELKINT